MPISDKEIRRRIEEEGLIQNAEMTCIQNGVLAYGVSASGYLLRCGHEFKVAKNLLPPGVRTCPKSALSPVRGYILDPKNPHPDLFTDVYVPDSEVLILHPGEYALGCTLEKINMPRDLMVVMINKSSYARNLINVNVGPFESEWSGWPIIEMANVGTISVAIYPGEGIAQILFFEIQGEVEVSYPERDGQYQNQTAHEMLSKIK